MQTELVRPESDLIAVDPSTLERRGRWWIFGSFLLCPCHLPLTLGLLTVVLGGTGVGAVVGEHTVAVGVAISALWLAGTAYGFVLFRRAQRAGGCSTVRAAPRP